MTLWLSRVCKTLLTTAGDPASAGCAPRGTFRELLMHGHPTCAACVAWCRLRASIRQLLTAHHKWTMAFHPAKHFQNPPIQNLNHPGLGVLKLTLRMVHVRLAIANRRACGFRTQPRQDSYCYFSINMQWLLLSYLISRVPCCALSYQRVWVIIIMANLHGLMISYHGISLFRGQSLRGYTILERAILYYTIIYHSIAYYTILYYNII